MTDRSIPQINQRVLYRAPGTTLAECARVVGRTFGPTPHFDLEVQDGVIVREVGIRDLITPGSDQETVSNKAEAASETRPPYGLPVSALASPQLPARS